MELLQRDEFPGISFPADSRVGLKLVGDLVGIGAGTISFPADSRVGLKQNALRLELRRGISHSRRIAGLD